MDLHKIPTKMLSALTFVYDDMISCGVCAKMHGHRDKKTIYNTSELTYAQANTHTQIYSRT